MRNLAQFEPDQRFTLARMASGGAFWPAHLRSPASPRPANLGSSAQGHRASHDVPNIHSGAPPQPSPTPANAYLTAARRSFSLNLVRH